MFYYWTNKTNTTISHTSVSARAIETKPTIFTKFHKINTIGRQMLRSGIGMSEPYHDH